MTEAGIDALPVIVSVFKETGMKLAKALQQHATIAIWLPYYSSFDLNMLLLWGMAVGTFILAGLWAGSDSLGSEHSYLKAGDQQVKCMMRSCLLSCMVTMCDTWIFVSGRCNFALRLLPLLMLSNSFGPAELHDLCDIHWCDHCEIANRTAWHAPTAVVCVSQPLPAVTIARPRCGCTAAQIPRTTTADVPVPCKVAMKQICSCYETLFRLQMLCHIVYNNICEFFMLLYSLCLY